MEYRVGIDLGGTNVAVGVVDENKEIIARATVKTRPDRMLDDVIYDIAGCVKEAVKKAGITLADCVSVGIGSPGYCRASEGLVVYANNLGWKMSPSAMSCGRSLAFRCAFPMTPTALRWAKSLPALPRAQKVQCCSPSAPAWAAVLCLMARFTRAMWAPAPKWGTLP